MVFHCQRVRNGMAGRSARIAEGKPCQHTALRHGIVRFFFAAQKPFDIIHDNFNCRKRRRTRYGIARLGPVTFCRVAYCIQRGRNSQLNRHGGCQHRVDNSCVSVIVLRIYGIFFVVLGIPHSGPAGYFAAGACRCRNANPLAMRFAVSFCGNHIAHGFQRIHRFGIQAAQRFANIQYAAAADGNNQFIIFVFGFIVNFI